MALVGSSPSVPQSPSLLGVRSFLNQAGIAPDTKKVLSGVSNRRRGGLIRLLLCSTWFPDPFVALVVRDTEALTKFLSEAARGLANLSDGLRDLSANFAP